jgi:hypothetical protein
MISNKTKFALGMLLLLLLAGCAGGEPPAETGVTLTAPPAIRSTPTASESAALTPVGSGADGGSGIRGQVSIGPTCPVQTEEDTCADKPYQASFLVLDAAMQTVAAFKTDAQGRFSLALPPGTYTLRAEHGSRYPLAADQTVVVHPGEYTRLDIRFDSGMR